jgi:hypothetical protein
MASRSCQLLHILCSLHTASVSDNNLCPVPLFPLSFLVGLDWIFLFFVFISPHSENRTCLNACQPCTPSLPHQPGLTSELAQYIPQNGYGPPTQYFPHAEFRPDIPSGMPVPSQAMSAYGTPQRTVYGDVNPLTRMAMGTGQPQGMFTRNLIGSLAASAFRLTDPDDKIGIWFILQDLSVRTEGNFR